MVPQVTVTCHDMKGNTFEQNLILKKKKISKKFPHVTMTMINVAITWGIKSCFLHVTVAVLKLLFIPHVMVTLQKVPLSR